MSKNNEHKLVPKLRFPEFINDEGWEETTLGKISDITNGKSNAQDHIENGKYPLFDRSAVIKASNNFLFDCEAVIIPGEGMRFIPKYYKGKFDLHQRAYVLKDFSIDGMFGYYSMSHRSDLLALKAVKSTVLSLRLPILQNFPIEIPRSRKEQQKIAACLLSLDEVITAESQKLEVLKDHKKGLLQNLLPQASETVPKFRFKEFENNGEWVVKRLGDICDLITKGTTPRSFSENGIRFIKIEAFKENYIDSSKCVFIDEGIHLKELKRSILKENDILFAIAGATIGKVNIVTSELLPANTNQALAIIRLKKEEETAFVLNILKSEMMQKYIKKSISVGAQPNLNLEQMGDFTFPYPPSKREQKKIADTLSSIDDLIKAQSQKLEALQFHKKGLLQGLFPQLSETGFSGLKDEQDENK